MPKTNTVEKPTTQETPAGNKIVEPSDPMELGIRDFEQAIKYSVHDRTKAIAFLVTCAGSLTLDEQSMLRDILPMDAPNEILDIDLKVMMQEQMNAARALRNTYFNADGSIRLTADVKEAREALKSSQQIMDSILKKQEKIDNASKLMIMEQSLLAIAQELPKELQEKFYRRVERILGEQDV